MALIALVAIAGWIAVLTIVFNFVLRARLNAQADGLARGRAQSAAREVRLDRRQPLDNAGDARDYGLWVFSGHTLRQRPAHDSGLRAAADSLARRRGAASRAVSDIARLASVPIIRDGRRVGTVVASVSLDPYERSRHTALIGSALVSALLLIGAYPVLRLTGRRALQPVEQMTRQAAEWSAHAPGQRFGADQRFVELHQLATTLDGVLDRLASVLRHEQQLSAELSHELRTPLSTILAEADLLLGEDPESPGYRAIHDNALRMNDIITTLLATARAELQSDRAASDVRAAIESVVARRSDPAPVEIRAAPGVVAGVDAGVLSRLLTPLIDNAVRHARTAVCVEVSRDAEAVRITVRNDGPPVAPDDLSRIFDAGYSGGDGAGLGLTLARRLARAADGDVVAAPAERGACFVVTLPPG